MAIGNRALRQEQIGKQLSTDLDQEEVAWLAAIDDPDGGLTE